MSRTALVTGANRGIGEKIAEGLAGSGLDLVLGVRDPASCAALADRLEAEGASVSVEPIDTGDAASIAALADRLSAAGRTIDVLVNNAATLEGDRLLDMLDEEIVRSTFVNALGPLRLIRVFSQGMAERGYGRIVNLSSNWGTLSDLGPGAYGVTKAFLNAITVKAASELPASVKVNAMCPGWVQTRMGGAGATRTPETGADTAIWLATLADDGPSGGFFRDRTPIPWL